MQTIPMVDPARLGVTLLPDGRRLGWAEWGPDGGMPVLFCPGAATSRWLGFGSDVVDELGIRLISVDRPGLGASDPRPGRTLTDWARDVAAFAHARNLTGLSVVGFSQGAPFALACAAAGAEAFFAGMTEAMMWEMVIGMSAGGDRAVYTAPAFAQAFRRAMAEGFAQRRGMPGTRCSRCQPGRSTRLRLRCRSTSGLGCRMPARSTRRTSGRGLPGECLPPPGTWWRRRGAPSFGPMLGRSLQH